MRFTRTDDAKPGNRLPLIGMIDVFFLLLIYFLSTATITPPEAELSAGLSIESQSAAAADLEPQIIRVRGSASGQDVFEMAGQTIMDQEGLRVLLGRLPKEPGVFIRADDDASVRAVAAALQASEDAGFSRITYVAPDN